MRTVMRQTKRLLGLGFIFFFAATVGRAQMPEPAAPAQEQGAPPAVGQRKITNDGPGRPLVGKITTINKGSVELAKPDGTTATVKLTDKTEYRNDLQTATLTDNKDGGMR